MVPLELTPPKERPPRRRPRRDPVPRFRSDKRDQLDAVAGCPSLQLPSEHLAREIWRVVGQLDLSEVEGKYSSLGRRGNHPRNVLAVWLYASRIGIHHATVVEKALRTDAAFRFLSGGHWISASVLRKFRQFNAALFEAALVQTIKLCVEADLVKPMEMAVDSVRLRAHASSKAVRSLSRSRKRLEELAAVDVQTLSPTARVQHDEKVAKHRAAIDRCESEGRPNYVTTCASAGFLKFPDGASGPGHRVNVAACGVRERVVVGVFIDAGNTDWGKLQPTVQSAVDLLRQAGVPDGTKLQVAADPGYYSEKDLVFADDNRAWIDVLIRQRRDATPKTPKPSSIFPQSAFRIEGDTAICPAGTTMNGPYRDGTALMWQGRGCAQCALRPQCTTAKIRNLTVRPAFQQAHASMQQRMQQPDADTRYAMRMATIEPVFSDLESVMNFRRLTSRHTSTVTAEILLKLLAHNVACLIRAKGRLLLFFVALPNSD